MAAEPAPEPAPEPSFWRILERLTVIGLPIAAAASAAMTALARLVLVPLYAEAALAPGALAGWMLGWTWQMGVLAVPLGGWLLCRLVASAPLRVAIAVIVFHIWLLLFIVSFVGIAWPALRA